MKILALIMAGGAGSRLEVLTEQRAKPALAYGGVYKLIDFPLSNCMHSHIRDVWIVQQYQPHSLNDHVSNGRPWDLDRTHGGLRILFPHTGGETEGWHEGNADAIYHNAGFIREMNPDVLMILSADHIYKLDYRAVIDAHVASKAHVTMVTTTVPPGEAGRFGVVEVDDGSRIIDFRYKPDDPSSEVVTTEVFLFDTGALLDLVDDLARRQRTDGDDDVELEDLGDEVLPRLVEGGRAYEYRLDGYWRDVGTVESYWASHMDLLDEDSGLDLDDREWKIHTLEQQLMPARIFESARIDNSLISPGGILRGRVAHSVLGPGVVVEEGALVRDSVVLHDCVIKSGATIDCSILDVAVTVEGDAQVGARLGHGAPHASDIAVVGTRATVGAGSRVAPGARISSEPAR
jgi:glucose-1-phosphate adenylyltransferase